MAQGREGGMKEKAERRWKSVREGKAEERSQTN